jgi:type II secretory ATPase GspE/PulE/Tfp pilus assembly ATPase PilB-like protein
MSDNNKSKININANQASADLADKLASIHSTDVEKETEKNAQAKNLDYINFKGFPISSDALALVSLKQAQESGAVCFYYTGEEIRFASQTPKSESVQTLCRDKAEELHAKHDIYMISNLSWDIAIKAYEKIPVLKENTTGVSISEKELEEMKKQIETPEDLQKKITEVSTTQVIALMIASALKFDTSDIHVEAEEKGIKLRLRIDGELTTMATMPKEMWPKIISRVKLLSNLKLNLTTAPQDGRFTIQLTDDKIDVRVSTMPTAFGESIVMRLLKSSAASLAFTDLGLQGKSKKDLEFNIKRPNGMIVTTGPTGSGKTTTLYAVLNELNDDATKIITMEDPIEYKLKGLNQSQVDASKGYTFAKGLKSILRQDPDIVMVGEIRDLETAEVAINAALTGHLMISTIHTNSAAAAIPRFLAMGVKPFLLAPAINAIMGQRLLRRLCKECKTKYTPEPELLDRVKSILLAISPASGDQLDEKELNNLEFYKPVGCDKCNNGYKGRVGVYEVLTMNEEIEQMILSGKISETDAQAIAIKSGMVTMVQDAILKAKDGITSIEEVFDKTE